ncbi:MAG: hypothetical protein ACFCUI_12200 [Bernardetiaceae bacterium]
MKTIFTFFFALTTFLFAQAQQQPVTIFSEADGIVSSQSLNEATAQISLEAGHYTFLSEGGKVSLTLLHSTDGVVEKQITVASSVPLIIPANTSGRYTLIVEYLDEVVQ